MIDRDIDARIIKIASLGLKWVDLMKSLAELKDTWFKSIV